MDMLSAMSVEMEQAASVDTFEQFLQVAFRWDAEQVAPNAAVLFPGFSAQAHPPQALPTPGGYHMASATSDTATQQQQQQQSLLVQAVPASQQAAVPSPFAGTAIGNLMAPSVNSHGRPAAASPFSHKDASALPAPASDSAGAAVAMAEILHMQQLLQQQQQQQQQRKQQGQQPGRDAVQLPQSAPAVAAPQQAALLPDDDQDDEGEETEQGEPLRRGRPRKAPGKYSKGYLAVKRYREKKKGKVQQMEAELAARLAQVAALQAEQQDLQHKHQALASTIDSQEELLSQMNNLTLSLGPSSRSAAQTDELHHQHNSNQQQQQPQNHLEGLPAMWARYKAYVESSARQLAVAAAAPAGAAAVNRGGFAPWPMSLAEGLRLWNLSRVVVDDQGLPDSSATSSSDQTGHQTINLATGRHEGVPAQFWEAAARQLTLEQQQLRQLEAAWELLNVAMVKLNQERQEIRAQLQALGAATGAGASSKAAGLAAGPASGSDHGAAGVDGGGGAPVCCWSVQEGLAGYEQLMNRIESNLMRGRAISMMFGWSMLCLLNEEQLARLAVACWPFFPLVRAIIGHLLSKPEMRTDCLV